MEKANFKVIMKHLWQDINMWRAYFSWQKNISVYGI